MLVNCSERRQPLASSTHTISQYGVSTRNSPNRHIASAAASPFHTSSGRKPNWRMMRGASVFITIAPAVEVKVISPDCSGLRPKPSCSISGSRNGVAPMPMRNSEPPSTPARKVGTANRSSRNNGSGCRRACRT